MRKYVFTSMGREFFGTTWEKWHVGVRIRSLSEYMETLKTLDTQGSKLMQTSSYYIPLNLLNICASPTNWQMTCELIKLRQGSFWIYARGNTSDIVLQCSGWLAVRLDKRSSNHLCIGICTMNGSRHRCTPSRRAPSKPFPFTVVYLKNICNKD